MAYAPSMALPLGKLLVGAANAAATPGTGLNPRLLCLPHALRMPHLIFGGLLA